MRTHIALLCLAASAAAQFQTAKQSDNPIHHVSEHFQMPHAHFDSHAVHGGDRSDAHRSFEQICEENGFAFEVHEVTTDDGYILNVFRIPGMLSEHYHSTHAEKPPVLLQHGLFDSAYCWIVNYADVAPAFVAARAGYDVWLGNSRGNTFSRAHTHLDPDHDKEFWNYTWQDMGAKDLPPVIDMIQKKTDGQKVAYVGHSQGTTQMFSALSENSAYFEDKVPIFVAVGPVTKISHTGAQLFSFTSHFYDEVVDTADLLGIHEIGGANWYDKAATNLFCVHIPEFCEVLSELFVTDNPDLDDNDRFAVYAAHSPNGTSMKDVMHYT